MKRPRIVHVPIAPLAVAALRSACAIMVVPTLALVPIVPASQSAWAGEDASAREAQRFLRAIYADYAARPGDQLRPPPPWQSRGDLFTGPTLALIARHQALLTEIGVIDGDPFCGCQEWTGLSVDRITTRRVAHNRVSATVTFQDRDGRRQRIAYRLVHSVKGWRIDDMLITGTSPDNWLVPLL